MLITKTGYVPILVPNIPDDVPWDKQTFDPWDLWCPKLWQHFVDAINERREAVGLSILNDANDPWSWNIFQKYISQLLVFYANKWQTTGTKSFNHIKFTNPNSTLPEDQTYLDLPTFVPSSDPTAPKSLEELLQDDPYYCIQTCRDVWWEILKFRRVYPLTIFRLDDRANGKSGRARFEATIPGDNSFQTPVDQVQYSGKFFEGGNGSWTLSSDQISQPTPITDMGFSQRKDYIGSWILEDIRAAIRKLRYTYSIGKKDVFGINDPIYFASTFDISWHTTFLGEGGIADNTGPDFEFLNVPQMAVASISNYTVTSVDSSGIGAINWIEDLAGELFSAMGLSASEGYARFQFSTKMNKLVHLYISGDYTADAVDSKSLDMYNAGSVFQNFGQPISFRQFTNFDDIESDSVDFRSKTLGNASSPPQPWGYIASASIGRSDGEFVAPSLEGVLFGWGYSLANSFAVCDWFRTGGFKYR